MSRLEKVINYIDRNKNDLFRLLSEMIQINTENTGASGSEKNLALYISGKLNSLGVENSIYSPDSLHGIADHPDYLPGRNLADRTNITAFLPGENPVKSLMLASHLDTMPVGDLALWTVPPTDGLIKDGRIYGRGACDDKYGLATWLFLIKAFRELGITFENDYYFSGYVDEEYGGGDGALACCLKYPCDFYLNMDCKDFEIWNYAAGGQRIALNIKCDQLLSSCDRIIDGLMICRKRIQSFGARRKAELEENEGFSSSTIPDSALRILSISSGTNTNDRNRGCIDFAFYTDKSRDLIDGELASLFKSISDDLAKLDLSIDSIQYKSRFFKYGSIDKNDINISILKDAAKVVGRELVTRPSCLSDLSLFLGCAPSKACSFGAGRDFDVYGGAHLPDEYIECDALVDFAKVIAGFIFMWDVNCQNHCDN